MIGQNERNCRRNRTGGVGDGIGGTGEELERIGGVGEREWEVLDRKLERL